MSFTLYTTTEMSSASKTKCLRVPTHRPQNRREDEAEYGRYRTSEMIIVYMNAFKTSDTEVVVPA